MAYKSVRSVEGGKSVKKTSKQTRAPKPKTPKNYAAPRAVTGGKDVKKTTKQVKRISKGKAPLAKMPEPSKKYRQYRRTSRESGKGAARTMARFDLFGKGSKKTSTYLGFRDPETKAERRLAEQGRRTQSVLDIKPREAADVLMEYEGVKPKKIREQRIDQLEDQARGYKKAPKPKTRVKKLAQEAEKQYARKEIQRLRKQKGKGDPEKLAKSREQYQRAQRELGEIQEKRERVKEVREPGRQAEGIEALREGGLSIRASGAKARSKRPERGPRDSAGSPRLSGVITEGRHPRVRIPGTKKRVRLDEPVDPSAGEIAKQTASDLSWFAPIPAIKGAQLAIRGAKALRAGLRGSKAAKAAPVVPKVVRVPGKAPKGRRASDSPRKARAKEDRPVNTASDRFPPLKSNQPRWPGGKPKKPPAKPEPKPTGRKPAPPKPAKPAAKSKTTREQVIERFQAHAARRAAKPSTKLRDIGRPGSAAVVHPAVVLRAAKAGVGAHYGPQVTLAHYDAVKEDPGRVWDTTIRMLPGLVAAPLGILQNVIALPAARAALALTNIKEYSGAEITAPAEGELEAQADFLKEFASTMASGDRERIKEAILNDYGLLAPIMLGIPAAKVLGKPYRAVRGKAQLAAEVRRVEKGQPTPPRAGMAGLPPATAVGRGLEKVPLLGGRARAERGMRKEEAKGMAGAKRRIDVEKHIAADPIIKELRQAKGVRGRKGKANMADALYDVVAAGIPAGPKGVAWVKRIRDSLPPRSKELDADTIARHDVLDFVLANPKFLSDPHFRKAVDLYKAQAEPRTMSSVAKYGKQARTLGIPREEIPFGEGRVPEFEARVQKLAKEQGLEEPAYVSDVDVARQGVDIEPPAPARAGKKVHPTGLKLHDAAKADPTFGTLYRSSIAGPTTRRSFNLDVQRFAEKNIPFIDREGKRVDVLTRKQLETRAVREQFDMDKTVFVPIQQLKGPLRESSLIDMEAVSAQAESISALYAAALKRGDRSVDILKQVEHLTKSKAKGTKYMAFDRARAREFFDQRKDAPLQGLATAQRWASRAILGYSPSWVMLQPIAEGAQALAAVGPRNMLLGHLAYRKLTPEQKVSFQVLAGETPGSFGSFKDISGLTNETNALTQTALKTLDHTPIGKALRTMEPSQLASFVDRYKGGRIRRITLAGGTRRELRGFLRGQQGFIKGMDQVSRELKGKPLKEQMGYMVNHPEIAKRMESYLDDVLGNWTALTRREKHIAPFIIFYPFVRMSLRWALKSYPQRHPIKAGIMLFLAQQNATQLQALLDGPPSFFRQWAQVPIYGGTSEQLGQPTTLIDLSRIAPGANTLIEAAGGADESFINNLSRGLNPVLGAILAGVRGTDPLSGRSLVEKGEVVNAGLQARIAAAQLLAMPAPVRGLIAGMDWQKAVVGKPQTPTSELFRKITGQEPGVEAAARAFLPPIPKTVKSQRKAGYASRALTDKYGAPEYGESGAAARRALAHSVVGRQRLKALEQEYGVSGGGEDTKNLTGEFQFPENVEDMNRRVRALVKEYGGRAFLRKSPAKGTKKKRSKAPSQSY